MPIISPKRYFNIPQLFTGIGIMPAGWRINPSCTMLIRDPIHGVEKNLLAEARKNGTYEEVLSMPPTDPRHPYFTEYLWVTYANADPQTLSTVEKWHAWQARMYRECLLKHHHLGLLFDDMAIPENFWIAREALLRLPPEQLAARERRLYFASELIKHGEVLPPEQRPPASADVAYLMPYVRMVHDELNEARSYT